MSALPPKADMVSHDRDVRKVPKADIGVSFDDFVSTGGVAAAAVAQTAYYSPRAAAATAANRPKTNVPSSSTISARIGNARPNIASDGRLTAGKVISNAA